MAIELFLASAGQVRRKAHTAAIELLLASVGFMPAGPRLAATRAGPCSLLTIGMSAFEEIQ